MSLLKKAFQFPFPVNLGSEVLKDIAMGVHIGNDPSLILKRVVHFGEKDLLPVPLAPMRI
jgi:hypothetical protein